MKLSPLRGRRQVVRLRHKGNVWRGKHMKIIYMPIPRSAIRDTRVVPIADRGSRLYVGTYASTHLHKSAVKRNRMRRRCREAFRLTMKQKTSTPENQKTHSIQLLLTPRSSSLTVDFAELKSDVENFLKHVHYA